MMNKNTLIELISGSANSLNKAASALGDKANWSPLDKGRSAVNQLVECGGFMRLGALTVENRAFPAMTGDELRAMRDKALAENDTLEKALASLHAGASALTNAIANASDEDLQNTMVTLPFGGGIQKTLAEFITLIYWNSTYHEGQINYIETLL